MAGIFTDDAIYRIIRVRTLSTDSPLRRYTASKGYLQDRVVAIRQTSVYAPRYMRRLVSNIRILGWQDDRIEVRQLCCLRDPARRADACLQRRAVPRYALDVDVGGSLKFKEKLVIFDSELIPNSLIYPL